MKIARGTTSRDLEIYQIAHGIGVETHRFSLSLPKFELYETGSQLRRSSKSVSANIVEGFCRRRYKAEFIRSNLHVPSFPYRFDQLYAVTCWRKDARFHKEVIEYETAEGQVLKTLPMDIEPVTSSVLFRWHKHAFPTDLEIKRDSLLHIRVILDWKVCWESYLMIEKHSGAAS